MSDIKIIEIYFDITIWANIINDRCWNLGYNLSLYDFSPCIIWLALVERSTNNGIYVNVSHNAFIIERIVSVFDLDIVVQKKKIKQNNNKKQKQQRQQNRKWLNVVCTLIDNDIRHQNVVDSRSALLR